LPFDEEDFLCFTKGGFRSFAETCGPLDFPIPLVLWGDTGKALPAQAPAFGIALYLGRPASVTTQETRVFVFLAGNRIPREQINLHGASFYHENR
jgi:hypothetical protein